jgi:transposase
MNKIHALMAKQSLELQEEAGRVKNIFTRRGLEMLMNLDLSLSDRSLLEGLVDLYRVLTVRIKSSNGLVKDLFKRLPEAQLIRTIPGFGAFFSVLAATEIADVNRFSSVSQFHSYAGVIPSTHATGGRIYHGKIIKSGNKWLRWAAVEAVQPACQSDFDIRCHYGKRARRKKANVAKVATARYLLTIVYKVLKEKRAYISYKRS